MSSNEHFTPSHEVMTTIVLPTIGFCVGLIVAMLVGINKCKEWEIDKVGEMRRTRRVIQRITARLREKNFRTIEKARRMRKQAHEAAAAAARTGRHGAQDESPPLYSSAQRGSLTCGRSPPPSYEDALLDEYYNECKPKAVKRRVSGVSTKFSTTSAANSRGATRRRASSSTAAAVKARRVPVRNNNLHSSMHASHAPRSNDPHVV